MKNSTTIGGTMKANQVLKSMPATVYSVAETDNPSILRGRVRIFYRGVNRNGSIINEFVAQQLVDSLSYVPIKGNYSVDEKDFGGHDGQDNERIYGLVPSKEDRNFAWEDHEDEDGVIRNYACSDIFIWRMYDEAEEILGKSQSMELNPDIIDGDWVYQNGAHYFEFSNASFLGLQVLGDDVEPCFEGSSFFSNIGGYEALLAYAFSKLLKDTNIDSMTIIGGDMDKKEGILTNSVNFEKQADKDVVEEVEEKNTDQQQENTEPEANEEAKVPEEELPVNVVKDTSDETKIGALESDSDDREASGEVPGEGKPATQGEDGRTDKEDAPKAKEDLEEETQSESEYSQKDKSENDSKIIELEEQISTYEREIEELREFKANVELNEKKEVLSTYEGHISEESFANYEEKLSDYDSVEELEKDLAYEIIKSNKDFSRQDGKVFIPTNDSAIDSNTEVKSVLDEYRK